MIIKKEKAVKFIFLGFLLLTLVEFLYNNTGFSGIYSNYIYILMAILLIIVKILINNGKIKNSIIELFLICFIFFNGMNSFSLRYSIFFLLILLMNDLIFEDMEKYHKLLIIVGGVYCFFLLLFSKFRVSGFLGILSIYLSKSGSTFLFAIFLVLYKIFINLLRKENSGLILKNKSKLLYYSFLFLIILIIFLVLNNLDFFLSIVNRDNRSESTNTRIYYYELFFDLLKNNSKMVFIGNGAGYVTKYISNLITTNLYVPLHQDFLRFICEDGLIGCGFMYVFFIKKLKMNWLLWLTLFLCSFHNFILSPSLVCLFILTNNSLNYQHNLEEKIWR